MNNLDFSSRKILVVGDIMLDRYWFGSTNRISPEAPVPIVRVLNTSDRLGGAANVALNARSLGASVSIMSVIGNDIAGQTILDLLKKSDITPIIRIDSNLETTVKLRILAKQQQILRVDFENRPQQEVLSALLHDFELIIRNYDVLVMSDYGKGGLTHIHRMISIANKNHIPVLVDPKGCDYSRYKKATLITPNRDELSLVVGKWSNETDLHTKALSLMKKLELKALLLTRSEEGMTLFTENKISNIPAQAKEVYDVSGAGDTVIAVLATLIAAGVSLEQAVSFANRAGGIVVGKLGTSSITRKELFGIS